MEAGRCTKPAAAAADATTQMAEGDGVSTLANLLVGLLVDCVVLFLSLI